MIECLVLGLSQCVESVDSYNLLDLVCDNFTDLNSIPVDCGLVKPDNVSPCFEYLFDQSISNTSSFSCAIIQKYLRGKISFHNFLIFTAFIAIIWRFYT
jgi:hypothetical protein